MTKEEKKEKKVMTINEDEIEKMFENESLLLAFTKFVTTKIGVGYLQRYMECRKNIDVKMWKQILDVWQRNNVFISGRVGVGKTMGIIYLFHRMFVIKSLMLKEIYGIHDFSDIKIKADYIFFPQLLSDIHKDTDAVLASAPMKYTVIDDIGTGYIDQYAFAVLETIIEKMYANGTHFLSVSNFTIQQILKREGWQRVNDRVLENVQIFTLNNNVSYRTGINYIDLLKNLK